MGHTDGGRVICRECRWSGRVGDMLQAPNPFDPRDTILACPECKTIENSLYDVCDEPGCMEEATSGTPTDTGYRRTCCGHRPQEVPSVALHGIEVRGRTIEEDEAWEQDVEDRERMD